jgi:hypothetical protein
LLTALSAAASAAFLGGPFRIRGSRVLVIRFDQTRLRHSPQIQTADAIAETIMTWSETALIGGVSAVLAAIATVFIMAGVQAVLGV